MFDLKSRIQMSVSTFWLTDINSDLLNGFNKEMNVNETTIITRVNCNR